MDYRMYKGGATANENVIPLIKESILQSDGIKTHTPFRFIGFQGDVGTEFYLNGSNDPMEIPDCGYFITPFDGERYRCIREYVLKNN